MQTILIENVENLIKLASIGNGVNVFIRLNYGFRSCKFISFDGKRLYIFNAIDDTEQRLLPKNLGRAGLLVEAIATGNCFAELGDMPK